MTTLELAEDERAALVQEWRDAKEALDQWAEREKYLRNQLLLAIPEDINTVTIDGHKMLTVVSAEYPTFQQRKFREAYPDLAADFITTSWRRSLRRA